MLCAVLIMGQYRFSVYAHWQIGLMVKFDEYSLDISLPFMTMHIAISKHAKGVEIFGKYFG
jgi:hypothetical protein